MNEPKISVIIPLYNAEKYIRECLISVLASKFKDCEVLVVDDCSTDNSLDIVKKLSPHFEGRLKILSTEKNSGGAGFPRNVGIKNAAGKYVAFVDSDDLILPSTLADFFKLAEYYQADVVFPDRHFIFHGEFKGGNDLKATFNGTIEALVDVPTLEPDDLRERINLYVGGKFTPWGKFYRRDFLLENNIEFPQVKFSEDNVFNLKCICLAKNYLCVPHVMNIYRIREGSTSRKTLSSREGVKLWLGVLTNGIVSVSKFMNEQIFFQQNPDYRRVVLKFFINKHFEMIKDLFQDVPNHEVQEIFFDELQNPELNSTGKNLVAAYLYTETALRSLN